MEQDTRSVLNDAIPIIVIVVCLTYGQILLSFLVRIFGWQVEIWQEFLPILIVLSLFGASLIYELILIIGASILKTLSIFRSDDM